MLKKFALDPELFADFSHFSALRDKFGFAQGRLISRFPAKWKAMVREACKRAIEENRLNPARANTIMNWMAGAGQNDRRMVASATMYDGNTGWLENAVANQSHFDCLLSPVAIEGEKWVHADDDQNYVDDPRFASAGQRNIKRTASGILACIRPLVDLSMQIRIIEPHFDPVERRFRRPLIELIDYLSAAKRRICVELHVLRLDKHDQDRFTPATVRNYRGHIDPELPTGIQLKIFFWAHAAQRMHPRYLLTDRGGIKLDFGWDEAESPDEEAPAIRMEEALWREESAKYVVGSGAFTLDPTRHILLLGSMV
jgi:hypothetical protein